MSPLPPVKEFLSYLVNQKIQISGASCADLYNVKHHKILQHDGNKSDLLKTPHSSSFTLHFTFNRTLDIKIIMKFITFVVTFLAIASAAQAGNPQNAIQLSASAQADAEVDTPAPTPAATTFADLPTPAPTNFSDPTPAPTFPTAAPTESADVTTIEDAAQNEERSSSSTVGVVGVAYNTEGTVGVAFSTTRAEYEAENNSSTESGNGATVPIVVIGCLVGVIGMVAAVVVARKRKANVAEEGETDYANVNTPAASVKAEDAYASTIRTPAAGEAGEVEYSNAIHTPVATV